MRPLVIIFSLFCLTFQACDQVPSEAQAIKLHRDHKTELIQAFSGHSVFKRGDLVILLSHKDGIESRFSFKYVEGSLRFTSDSLKFGPDFDFKSTSFLNMKGAFEVQKLEDYASRLLAKMDSLQINELTSEDSRLGIDLQFYLKNDTKLIYVSDFDQVENQNWQSYLKGGKKLDENWFFFSTIYN